MIAHYGVSGDLCGAGLWATWESSALVAVLVVKKERRFVSVYQKQVKQANGELPCKVLQAVTLARCGKARKCG